MKNSYFIDIEQFSLIDYRKILERVELLPGRRILHEKIKERFDLLLKHGIKNLFILVDALRTPDKIRQLSKNTNIPENYLIILKREINRLLPKPVSLSSFPGVDEILITKLNAKRIKNTLQFFENGDTKKKRSLLAKELEVSILSLEELIKLADLSRIWGVGPIFCRIFYETGTDSVKKVANSDAEKLYDQLLEINRIKKYTKVKFTIKDVAQCIEIANDLPKTIEI